MTLAAHHRAKTDHLSRDALSLEARGTLGRLFSFMQDQIRIRAAPVQVEARMVSARFLAAGTRVVGGGEAGNFFSSRTRKMQAGDFVDRPTGLTPGRTTEHERPARNYSEKVQVR